MNKHEKKLKEIERYLDKLNTFFDNNEFTVEKTIEILNEIKMIEIVLKNDEDILKYQIKKII